MGSANKRGIALTVNENRPRVEKGREEGPNLSPMRGPEGVEQYGKVISVVTSYVGEAAWQIVMHGSSDAAANNTRETGHGFTRRLRELVTKASQEPCLDHCSGRQESRVRLQSAAAAEALVRPAGMEMCCAECQCGERRTSQ